MEFLVVVWLAAWIIPVIVLFNKGQTAWALTGLLFGWALAIVWIIAAIATPNRRTIEAERRERDERERRHRETLAAMTSQHASNAPAERTIEQRLATLDELLSTGRISSEEYSERRKAIIESI